MRLGLALAMLSVCLTSAVKRSALKHSLIKAQSPAACTAALEELQPLRTPKEYGLAIAATDRCHLPGRSLALLRAMQPPDEQAFNGVLSAMARAGRWRIALALLREMEGAAAPVQPSSRSLNAVLHALGQGGEPQRALRLLRSAPPELVDHVSYRTVLTGFARAKQWDRAVDLVLELREFSREELDLGTYGVVVQASRLEPVERELALIAAIRSRGAAPDRPCYMLAAHACKHAANASAAVALLDAHEAEEGLPPDAPFYAAVLATCERSRRWDLQCSAFERAERSGVVLGNVPKTLMLHSCARSGRWQQARALVEELCEESASNRGGEPPDAGLFSAAISACEAGGHWRLALDLLTAMRARRVEPDVGCFTAAMQALAAAGQVDAGLRLLRSMHGDATGGLGGASAAVLRASYPVHLILLKAAEGGPHAAAVQREVEALLHRRGIRPLAAKASTRPKRRTRGRGDGRDRMKRETYVNLDRPPALRAAVRELSERLERDAGYVPRHEALPPAFVRSSTRGQRERSLQSHAEKQALADLLARDEDGDTPLDLDINFHVCLDCHAYLAAASKLLGRPITVREPKLEHHFDDGECSCNGAWRWEARREAAEPVTVTAVWFTASSS